MANLEPFPELIEGRRLNADRSNGPRAGHLRCSDRRARDGQRCRGYRPAVGGGTGDEPSPSADDRSTI